MTSRFICNGLLPLVAGGMAVSSQVRALQADDVLAFSVGPLTLRPQLSVAEQFDSNISFRGAGNERSDFISTFEPGINLEFGNKDQRFQSILSYTFSQFVYAQTPDLDHGDHTIEISNRYSFNKLSINGTDKIQILTGLLDGANSLTQSGGANNLGRNVDRNIYLDTYQIGYAISEKTSLALAASHQGVDYASDLSLYDYKGFRGAGNFGYQAFSKLSIFGEFYYGAISTKPNLGGPKGIGLDQFGTYIGARGVFTEKVIGTIQAGYEYREFSDNSPSASSPVVELDLSYKTTEKQLLTLGYSRTSNVSVEALAGSYSLDAISFQLRQKLGAQDRLTALAGATLRFANYDDRPLFRNRSDVYYTATAGLNYQFRKWLTGAFEYEYEALDSSYVGVVDYDVNRVTLRLIVGY